MQIAFPFRVDHRGRTALSDEESHVRELIEQVLFTAPGERVNRPGLGTGLRQLVFAPSSDELATATQFLVQGALQQWLGELLQVDSVEVRSDDAALEVTVRYTLRRNQDRRVAEFRRPLA